MDSATAGLIGTVIGAIAGFGIAFFTHLWQTRHEKKQWIRTKRVESYSNATLALFRIINKKSGITPMGETYLAEEDLKEWFDDIANAQKWVVEFSMYCSDEQTKQHLDELSSELQHRLRDMTVGSKRQFEIGGEKFVPMYGKGIGDMAQELLGAVISAAQKDLHHDIR